MPFVIELGYNMRKAAHLAAWFALQAGGSIHARKLAALAYLADRRFLDRYDEPILFDHLVSGEQGPVAATFQGLLNGDINDAEWDSLIAAEAGHKIGISQPQTAEADLDELSEAELEVLRTAWDDFGHMDLAALANHASTECPEWEHSTASFEAIPYSRVFKFLGRHELSGALADDIAARMELNATLARIDHDVASPRVA